jgi:hypothetical protein
MRRLVLALILVAGLTTAVHATSSIQAVGQWSGPVTCPAGPETTVVREVPVAQIPLNAVALVGVSGWTYHTAPAHYLIVDVFHNGGTEHWLMSRMEVLEGLREAVTRQPAQWTPQAFPGPGHRFTGGGADRLYVRIRCLSLTKTARYQVFVTWHLQVED